MLSAADEQHFKQTELCLIHFLLHVDSTVNVWPLADKFFLFLKKIALHNNHESALWSLVQIFSMLVM